MRRGRLAPAEGIELLNAVTALPLVVRPVRLLARRALAIGAARSLSAYDSCYLAVAEAERATLVTADRRLAAAARCEVELLG